MATDSGGDISSHNLSERTVLNHSLPLSHRTPLPCHPHFCPQVAPAFPASAQIIHLAPFANPLSLAHSGIIGFVKPGVGFGESEDASEDAGCVGDRRRCWLLFWRIAAGVAWSAGLSLARWDHITLVAHQHTRAIPLGISATAPIVEHDTQTAVRHLLKIEAHEYTPWPQSPWLTSWTVTVPPVAVRNAVGLQPPLLPSHVH